MHELPQLHNWTAWLRTWSHYNPLKCWKLTPNRMAPISKRNDTCNNNTVRTSNLRLHWKEIKTLDLIKYSQVRSRVRWLSGEQTNTLRIIFVTVIKELSRTHQFMWSKFLQLIPHQLYEEKHKVTWHSMIHFLYQQQGRIRSQCPCLSAILQILLHSKVMEKSSPLHSLLNHLYSLTQPHSHSVKMLAFITSTQALWVGWYRPQQLEGEYNRRQKWKYKTQSSSSSMKLHLVVCTQHVYQVLKLFNIIP